MNDTELASLVAAQVRDSVGYLDSELSSRREKLLRYFNGEMPDVEDREGFSTVISRDVMETVEQMLPSLLKVFHSADNAVSFEPAGPEDEEAAEQATDYVNYVYNRDNPGFLISHDVIKDGLIQITGVSKTYWEEYEDAKEESYQNLSEPELAELEADEEVEILSQEQTGSVLVGIDPTTGAPIEAPLFDVEVRRTRMDGKVCIEAIPPEDFLVKPRMRRLDPDTEPGFFCAHRAQRSRSDLIEAGYDAQLVMDLPADETAEFDTDRDARYPDEDETLSVYDEANEIVTVYECYLKLDADGDGIAELRKVVTGGLQGSVILENEACEDFPFDLFCPYRMPHAIFGEGAADKVQDIQKIKTALWRGVLDNVYLTNSPEMEVPEQAITANGETLDDLAERKVGGIIRTAQGGLLSPNVVPFMGNDGIAMIQYVNSVKEDRTGVSKTAIGLNPDLLQSHTRSDVKDRVMDMSQERIELVARMAAETFYKPLFRRILRLLHKYQPRERMVRLRNTFVPMDPRSWNADMDMSINVGLGTGDRGQKIAYLMSLLDVQREAVMAPQLGLVRPRNIYNTLEELTKAIDLPSVDPYFMDPEGEEAQAYVQQVMQASQGGEGGTGEADAYMAGEQMKVQQRAQADAMKHQREVMQIQSKMQLAMFEMVQKMDLERDKLDVEVWKVQQQLQAEFGVAVTTEQIKADIERLRMLLPQGQPQPAGVVQ